MKSSVITVRRLLAPIALIGLVAISLFMVWPAPINPTETIADDEYAALLAALPVRPGEELYTTVPWETSLAVARMKAWTERKPLLIWSMDGHPLGCG